MVTSKLLRLALSGSKLFTSEDTSILFTGYLNVDINTVFLCSTTDFLPFQSMTSNLIDNSARTASIAYMETSIGATYGFAAHSDSNTTSYIIPTPSELATTTSARWLSDVITINPTCSFVKTNISQPIFFDPTNANNFIGVNIPDAGIDLTLDNTDSMPSI